MAARQRRKDWEVEYENEIISFASKRQRLCWESTSSSSNTSTSTSSDGEIQNSDTEMQQDMYQTPDVHLSYDQNVQENVQENSICSGFYGLQSENRLVSESSSSRNEAEPTDEVGSAVGDEARRLAEILLLVETGHLSRNNIESILNTVVISSRFSYKTVMSHLDRKGGIEKLFLPMCSKGHVPLPKVGVACPVRGCHLTSVSSSRFWHRSFSSMIMALLKEKDSFQQILKGCQRAHRAMSEQFPEFYYDYYDAELFRTLFRSKMLNWDADNEIFVFMTLSTDGYEQCGGLQAKKTSWPVVAILLNYEPEHRARAANALVASFIPGSHSSGHFDSFLSPTVEDLKLAERGIRTECYDSVTRTLFVHILFVTGDYPASSKVLGFVGHNGAFPCRRCHKASVYVSEYSCNCLIPSGNKEERKNAISEGYNGPGKFHWIEKECIAKRSDGETRRTWVALDKLVSKFHHNHAQCKAFRKKTGISRRPILGELSLDFEKAFPYDPMHLLFLGFVRWVLTLQCGNDRRTDEASSFVISDELYVEICESLSRNAVGMPSSWGRPPASLEYVHKYKAEDLQNFALLFGPILFSERNNSPQVAKLWSCISRISNIVRDPTPSVNDYERLKMVVQRAHALFSMIFDENETNSFVFNPNSHALLHLPEMLKECGPLYNVSQFIIERLVGELRPMMKSRYKPDSDLFNKTHRLFSLRLLDGGLARKRSGDVEVETNGGCNWRSVGKGKLITRPQELQIALSFAIDQLTAAKNVHLLSVRGFKGAKNSSTKMHVESFSGFKSRSGKVGEAARQSFFVAAEFFNRSRGLTTVSYGKLLEIWEVKLGYLDSNNVAKEKTIVAAKVQWQQGLKKDACNGKPYVFLEGKRRRNTIRDTEKSVEPIGCIKRLAAFFDHNGRRYILDQCAYQIETDTEREVDYI